MFRFEPGEVVWDKVAQARGQIVARTEESNGHQYYIISIQEKVKDGGKLVWKETPEKSEVHDLALVPVADAPSKFND